jgi:ketosteroid isomerase-like protein
MLPHRGGRIRQDSAGYGHFDELASSGEDAAPIRTMMKDSADAWNRGDLPAFAAYYDDSPETAFMGKEIVRGGVGSILERYRKACKTRQAMGKLTLSEIEVRPLAAGLALVTGKFELERTPVGGGPA